MGYLDGTGLSHLISKIKAAFWSKTDVVQISIDNTPTESSDNLVKSGGVYSALSGKQDTVVFNTAYNASSNKAATMSDIPDAVEANPTVPSGTTPTTLSNLKVGSDYYSVPQGGGGNDAQTYYNVATSSVQNPKEGDVCVAPETRTLITLNTDYPSYSGYPGSPYPPYVKLIIEKVENYTPASGEATEITVRWSRYADEVSWGCYVTINLSTDTFPYIITSATGTPGYGGAQDPYCFAISWSSGTTPMNGLNVYGVGADDINKAYVYMNGQWMLHSRITGAVTKAEGIDMSKCVNKCTGTRTGDNGNISWDKIPQNKDYFSIGEYSGEDLVSDAGGPGFEINTNWNTVEYELDSWYLGDLNEPAPVSSKLKVYNYLGDGYSDEEYESNGYLVWTVQRVNDGSDDYLKITDYNDDEIEYNHNTLPRITLSGRYWVLEEPVEYYDEDEEADVQAPSIFDDLHIMMYAFWPAISGQYNGGSYEPIPKISNGNPEKTYYALVNDPDSPDYDWPATTNRATLLWVGTKAQYTAITNKKDSTLYICRDGAIYLGSNLIAEINE